MLEFKLNHVSKIPRVNSNSWLKSENNQIALFVHQINFRVLTALFSVDGSGHKGAAALLPGFAIIW